MPVSPRPSGRKPLPGKVWLVGAGPGAVDLLTLRAIRLIESADALVYDRLVPAEIVALAAPSAERFAVGKAKAQASAAQTDINHLLIRLAREGKSVVRLKSGDPLIFGRAGEEMAALAAADIAFEVVPGVTAALAAAAEARVPLTLRGVSSRLIFMTGHDVEGNTLPDLAGAEFADATIAIYMGKSVAEAVRASLVAAGLPPATPIVAIENAGRSSQRIFAGALADLASISERSDIAGPVMILAGDAVGYALPEEALPLKQPLEVAA